VGVNWLDVCARTAETGCTDAGEVHTGLQACWEERPAADVGVVYIDLDGFTLINDTFGHDAGDEVLLNSAHRMRSQLRPQDRVARLGGDEFAICAQHITSEGLAALVRRLKAFLAEPHQIHGKEVVVSGPAHRGGRRNRR